MPRGSSPKRERQYEHIKEGAEKRGASTERAKEIASRTVQGSAAAYQASPGPVAAAPRAEGDGAGGQPEADAVRGVHRRYRAQQLADTVQLALT
jgi:hypothetical protein